MNLVYRPACRNGYRWCRRSAGFQYLDQTRAPLRGGGLVFHVGIDAVEQTADPSVAVATVFSVMRSVSVPFGISTPDKPYIASTRWRSIADQKQRVYYYEATLVPSIFWIDLSRLDLRPGTPVRKLPLSDGQVYTGEASAHLVDGSLTFLFEA